MRTMLLLCLLGFATGAHAARLSSGLNITLTIQPGITSTCNSSGNGSPRCPPYTKRQTVTRSSALSAQEAAWLKAVPEAIQLNAAQTRTLSVSQSKLRTLLEF